MREPQPDRKLDMMKARIPWLLIRILLVTALAAVAAGAKIKVETSEPYFTNLTLPDGNEVLLTIQTSPTLLGCSLTAEDSGRKAYDCSGYSLVVELNHEDRVDLVSFSLARKGGGSFVIEQYGLTATHPYSPGDGIWSNNHVPVPGSVLAGLENPLVEESSANSGVPLTSVVDVEGKNRLALGLIRQDRHVTLLGKLADDKTTYALSLLEQEEIAADGYRDTFFV